jgi:hypothetical protein
MRVACLLLLTLAGVAFAQEDPAPEREVRYQDVTELTFDDLDVNAGIVRPDGTTVVEAPKQTFNPLIHFRASFDRELKASVVEVR